MEEKTVIVVVGLVCLIVGISGHSIENLDKGHVVITGRDRVPVNRQLHGTSHSLASYVLSGISRVRRSTYHAAEYMWNRAKRATQDENAENMDDKPMALLLDIEGKISNRFAETVVTSVMRNDKEEALEAEFELQIPETAFISDFLMIIDGLEYTADVREKEQAMKAYEEAKEENKTAGQVKSKPRSPEDAARGMEIFSITVNVAAKSEVKFMLTYQQQLERINEMYKYILSIRPNQIVEDLRAQIYLYEKQGLEFLEWKFPDTKAWDTMDNIIDKKTHKIAYSANKKAQMKMDPEQGINGDIFLNYDVKHELDIGLMQADQGYFVHHFSPSDLLPLGKNIVFVIDRSGSMTGSKIDQTKRAMQAILHQLREGDKFKIILFDTELTYWPPNIREMRTVRRDRYNIQEANAFLHEELIAGGGTNLNGGLVKGCKVLMSTAEANGHNIVFLTDGQPTEGEVDQRQIQINIRDETDGNIAIHSLGFGFDLDYELLKRLSWVTNGYIQRIYDDKDAAKQLEDFYERISSPLLFDVEIQYDSNAVDPNSLTNTNFPQYYQGSELTVTGRMNEDIPEEFEVSFDAYGVVPIAYARRTNFSTIFIDNETLLAAEEANGTDIFGHFTFSQVIDTSSILIDNNTLSKPEAEAMPKDFIEKFHTYMKIKELYKKEQIELDEDMKEKYHQQALTLAIEFKLVTPLTSMVIVQEEPPPDHGGSYEQAPEAAKEVEESSFPIALDISPPQLTSEQEIYGSSRVYDHAGISRHSLRLLLFALLVALLSMFQWS